ncbi:MAG: hypothetical protein SFW67_37225 [Myxococcaceae bacterium]|nr:hypothetical protein [Myxococcaceae bacterium]
MRMLGFLVLSACATTPLFDDELRSGQQRVATVTSMPKRESSLARLERLSCPEVMDTEQKLDCADFHDLSRNVRDAASLWVQVARDAEHPEQQCFAVHRLSARAAEGLNRVTATTVARCETEQAERLTACTSSCTSEVPECQGRQRAFVASTLAAQVLAYDWLVPEERFIPGLPLEQNLMRMPGFPACGKEFASCVAVCAMPRRVASR